MVLDVNEEVVGSKKSAPRIGWSTVAIENLLLNEKLCPKETSISILPKVFMLDPFAATKSNVRGRVKSDDVAGNTHLSAPESTWKALLEMESWTEMVPLVPTAAINGQSARFPKQERRSGSSWGRSLVSCTRARWPHTSCVHNKGLLSLSPISEGLDVVCKQHPLLTEPRSRRRSGEQQVLRLPI